ncbi:Serine/threonine-protein kinase haspin [Gigaspora margarita]|uniref:non-specific serine/threonine protein kinase n=1 Tax=Gigaspora margarita TaxID=4874 RepID=A0A8H3X8F9_GIGMA|nr:Serine/threonine-protein kinase haspin [Gigaspora margarita]
MHLLGTQTKTIKTYGKKTNERVIPVNKLNDEINISAAGAPKSFDLLLREPSRHGSKKPKKVFTKDFTKTKFFTSSAKSFNTPPRAPIVENTYVDRSTPTKTNHRIRIPLTPKNLSKNRNEKHEILRVSVYPSPTKDQNKSPSTLFNYTKENSPHVVPEIDHRIEFLSKEIQEIQLENSKSNLKPQCKNDIYKSNNTSDTEVPVKTISKIERPLYNNKSQESEIMELLTICEQTRIYSFQEFLGLDGMKNVIKIGEASFSEVFAGYAPKFTSIKTKCVFKIVPFGRGSEVLINGEQQCSIKDISQEIKITRELGGRTGLDPLLRVGFLKLYSVSICRGKYPIELLDEWDRWDSEFNSENDRPDYFDAKQLYVIFVVEHGGISLEDFKLKNWEQAWSLLTQVGWALAQAEQSLKFEHRDLHWGNITIKPTKNKVVTYELPSAEINVKVPTCGIRAFIIDYTLSRMQRGDEIIHVDMLDEGYFTAQGDYQFDIYRMMREETKGNWKSFCPKTNVFWLHYLADKLLTSKKLPKPRKTNEQYRYFDAITRFKKRALHKGGYRSAIDAMKNDDFWQI